MSHARLLFVDDEPSIRLTLPAILKNEGFSVTIAASVAEAVDFINKEKFDVLVSDLNIGQPGDGFTVVSVMRRVQPEAVTFILTGYPDFESALQAIRNQVDDYLTKPADVLSLVAALKQKLANRKSSRPLQTHRAPELLLDKLDEILNRWLIAVAEVPSFRNLAAKDQLDSFPELLAGICNQVMHGKDVLAPATRAIAAQHGLARFESGLRTELIVLETRLLQREIARVLQENLLVIDLSTLIQDVMNIADLVAISAEESIRSFNEQSLAA